MGMNPKNAVPPVPSLPTTTVNPQPRQEASPVRPAVRAADAQAPAKTEKAGDDKLLQQQPKTRDRSIELQALLKSTLESPMVAQLTMGQDQATAMKTFKFVFDGVLGIYTETK